MAHPLFQFPHDTSMTKCSERIANDTSSKPTSGCITPFLIDIVA
jgi:hypothetical protein